MKSLSNSTKRFIVPGTVPRLALCLILVAMLSSSACAPATEESSGQPDGSWLASRAIWNRDTPTAEL